MSLLTTNEHHESAQATQGAMKSLTREPGVIERTRSHFYSWLQAEFDRHYNTIRDGGYRRFLEDQHPTELERFDAACEALRREEFGRFAELQTLGLFLHTQVADKEALFRRRRNQFLMAMSATGIITSSVIWAYLHHEQFVQLCHQAVIAGHAILQLFTTVL
ncbi:hypothetical protein WCU81_08540 [Pectobacterium atrosepticum]|uniref:Uncharacterized protein n=2 Tax=Pectobacterium TaxID=122277 RepID=M4GXT2_PECAT|nr:MULTISPECIES: hypothetical protein [Pectobacterium]GKV85748.1 hypothetical protein PEC301296_20600 [Pectobacterium carotovorum subsp. carotovorum]AFH56887.1 hypothetical protein KCQ_13210 [Pectobacterium atrosepticum]KFX12441.1 hypothetical protein JV34_18440 [Pectobacterium atrosepticum]KML70048.1 hypothetical protein G033_02990 [Pectobacterium peruviense]MCL6389229.1 hypothetical protein [Pectobacterium atrosepticum]